MATLFFSESKLIENYNRFKVCFPNVEIFYAVKANPNSLILDSLKRLGSGFDVCSIGEFELVKDSEVIFTHPIKNTETLQYLKKKNVILVIDNEYEIEKIASVIPNARVLIRISENNPKSLSNLAIKFGVHSKTEIIKLICLSKKFKLNPIGICFHAGSQNLQPDLYVKLIQVSKEIFEFCCTIGIEMNVLDIGGGFPIKYLNNVPQIEEFCEPIRKALTGIHRVLAEPGRFLVGNTVTLKTTIEGKAVRDGVRWYYLDDGVYGSFSGKLFENCNYELNCGHDDEPKFASVLAGPTCDSVDIIEDNIQLPNLSIGDELEFYGMGAYTSCSATDFNGIKRTEIIRYP